MEDKVLQMFRDSFERNAIPDELYRKHDVKKGLRNEDGTGVLIGLTRIADVVGYKKEDGKKIETEGQLYYRGYSISDIVAHLDEEKICGYEEVCFLLLNGYLPNKEELKAFMDKLSDNYELPEGFLSRIILRSPSLNIMNKLQRSILMMYSEDVNPDEISIEQTFEKGLGLIAKMPAIIAYTFAGKRHIFDNESLIIHKVDKKKSIAENILQLLRADQKYSYEEAKLLDFCLVLHMDHGAGNNSTFTNIVVSSTGTDIYSCMAAAIGSLKGPKHGGANISVRRMMNEVIEEIGLAATDEEIRTIVNKILDKDFYDKQGLIYGMGHAVYTLSDPRAQLLKKQAGIVAKEKGMNSEFVFYQRFEKIAKEEFKKRKGQNICANVDFYSGLVYSMLEIDEELFTPMFVCARMTGWLAHNIENKCYCNKIVRPAGKYVGELYDYVEMEDR
ncbi:MAG: citrate synthase [Erysipelotrichaceae bacterium]|nr:citrate synthase [Erysipelotrichaceae bacterium]